jgi:O-antigen biosynthesis protein WbqP
LYKLFFKRALDLILSILFLPFVLLVIIVLGIIIKFEENGTIFFRQERVGKDGKIFRIFKLRTMYVTAPSKLPTCEINNPDIYITKIGRFLRRWSIDELPQFFNVIKGEMSLIGPRPLITAEKDILNKRKELGVTALKPGISGWAQINGRDEVSAKDKITFDAYYVEHLSFLFDVKILLLTFICVIFGHGYCEGRIKSEFQNEVITPPKTGDLLKDENRNKEILNVEIRNMEMAKKEAIMVIKH